MDGGDQEVRERIRGSAKTMNGELVADFVMTRRDRRYDGRCTIVVECEA